MNPPPDETPAALQRQAADPDLMGERTWMRRLALTLAGDDHDAADLEQDTWVKLLRNPPDRKVSLRAWIATVMRNTARNSHRGRTRRVAREELWSRGQPGLVEGGAEGLDGDVAQVLRRAVERLGEPYHEAIALRFYSQLTPKEIGEHLGIPAATVRTRLRRALQRLRQDLDGEHGGERSLWAPSLAAWALRPRGEEAGAVAVGGSAVVTQLVAACCAAPLLVWMVWSLASGDAVPGDGPAVVRLPDVTDGGTVAATLEVEPAPEPLPVGLPVRFEAGRDGPGAPAAQTTQATGQGPTFELTVLDFETDAALDEAVARVLDPDAVGVSHEGLLSARGTPAVFDVAALAAHALEEGAGVVRMAIEAPDHVTRDVLVPFGWDAQREIRLRPAGELALEVRGQPGSGLRLWAKPERGGRTIHQDQIVMPPEGTRLVTWGGLPEGGVIVGAVCAHEDPVLLSRSTVQVVAGDRVHAQLVVEDEHVAPATGGLSGTVLVPDHLAHLVDLRLHAVLDREQDPRDLRDHWLRVAHGGEPRPVPVAGDLSEDGRRRLSWSLAGLPEGRYEVQLLPFGQVRPVTVRAAEVGTVEHGVEALAEVEVVLRSGVDGRVLPPSALRWCPRWPLDGPRGRQARVTVEPDDEGRLRFVASPGRGRIHMQDVDLTSLAGWRGRLSVDLVPGPQRIELLVWPLTVVEVDLVSADTGEPLYPSWKSRLEVRCLETLGDVDPADAFAMDLSNTHRVLLLSVPGRYEIGVRPGVSRRPVAPVTLELEAGRPQRIRMVLEPRRD